MVAAKQAPSSEGSAESGEAGDDIAIVARGRSLHLGARLVTAGEEVILPATEITRLRKLGFLVDPDAEPVKEANGPRFERR